MVKIYPFLAPALILFGSLLSRMGYETLSMIVYFLGAVYLIFIIVIFFYNLSIIRRKNIISTEVAKIKLPAEQFSYGALVDSVERATSWKLVRKESNMAVFRTNITLSSFGELVTIKFGEAEIELTSGSLDDRTIFDWGKNQKNLDTIRKLGAVHLL